MIEISWLPILMYHRIVEREPAADPDGVCTSVHRLIEHLDWLDRHGYMAVPLELACRPGHAGEGRRFVITFDDAYEETLTLALPVLEARSLPSTVFVVSGLVGGGATWNAEPARLVSRSGLLELRSAGMLIGSHSRTHPRLSMLSAQALDDEVRGSRTELEDMLGVEVRFFAYPHHDLDSSVMAAVATADYVGAAGGRHGQHERFNLHRIDAGRMSAVELMLHVRGLSRWARRQPLVRALHGAALRFA